MSNGKFIVIEGVEGAGKSRQCALLADALGSLGYDAVLTREPGGAPLAEAVRKLLLDPAYSPEAGFARKGGADKTDRLECENLDFFNRVYDGFKAMCADGELQAIDGSGEKEQTAANILEAVRRIL